MLKYIRVDNFRDHACDHLLTHFCTGVQCLWQENSS